MQMLVKIYQVIRLLLIVIIVWIYCVGGGMMEKMMKSWMPEEKNVKAIPIPIPVLIKERISSPPPQMSMMMKTKDWIWKMMMLKMMKNDNKGKCKSKMIVFPSKNKCKCKEDCGECGNCSHDATSPPPAEDEPDYYDGPLMGWDTNNVFVYLHPEKEFQKNESHQRDKFVSERKCSKGDCGGSSLGKSVERTADVEGKMEGKHEA